MHKLNIYVRHRNGFWVLMISNGSHAYAMMQSLSMETVERRYEQLEARIDKEGRAKVLVPLYQEAKQRSIRYTPVV